MRQSASWLLAAVMWLGPTGEGLAADAVQELKHCARMNDKTGRAACYEALGRRALDSEFDTAPPVPPAPAVADTAVDEAGLPDDLGGSVFSKKEDGDDEVGRGHVVSCQQASDKRWFYVFDNGQVWKQVDNRGRRSRTDCDFRVTVRKDAFGYKMQIDGEDRSIRIRRFR